MADHFALIGVKAPTAEALSVLIDDLTQKTGDLLPCPPGAYQRLVSGAGAELWVHLQAAEGEAPAIAGITPFYQGEGRMPVRVRNLCQRPNDNAFEGAFYIELGPTIALVDVVDFARMARTATPFMALAQIAAFPQDLAVFPNRDAFEAAQDGKEVRFTSRSFLASGLFVQAPSGEVTFMDPEAPGFNAPSRAFFTGEVQAAAMRTNPWTGQNFQSAIVATSGGTLDLVASPDGAPLEPGCIVQGEFWLCARLV
jgi:hypothetical protein